MDSNLFDWDVEMYCCLLLFCCRCFMSCNKERKCFIDFLRQIYILCLGGETMWCDMRKNYDTEGCVEGIWKHKYLIFIDVTAHWICGRQIGLTLALGVIGMYSVFIILFRFYLYFWFRTEFWVSLNIKTYAWWFFDLEASPGLSIHRSLTGRPYIIRSRIILQRINSAYFTKKHSF